MLSSFFLYIDIFLFPFSLFVSVYVYASLCDFVCIVLLLPFVLGFRLSVCFLCVFVCIVFTLVIIGRFWFGCSLLSFFYYFLFFLFLIVL